ncbi:nucleotide exchange factor GrpE [bacterium]|jgi:molecular chaperone GrpE|nr:nucleotide exchange factor GrpE [bacterium]MBT3730182.1 nucleotide exchange factor GrpE [bacterium]MBT4894608.1 nucleotide exchange factor GrpE [bacterium]
MPRKKLDKSFKSGHNKEIEEDIVFDDIDEGGADTIKKLRDKLKKCVEEKQEYLDGWQRSKADFVNARKKEEELRGGLVAFAKEGLIQDLLTSVDNFDMAFANKEAWESVDKNWRMGIEHIHSQLLKTLEEHGLDQFDPFGEEFDHNRHDSVETVVTDKKEGDHKVVEVMQKGYVLGGKVIRPAKVKVGKFE